jgi:hypothetical protein
MGMSQCKILDWFPSSMLGEEIDVSNPACGDVAFRVNVLLDDDSQYYALIIDDDMRVWQCVINGSGQSIEPIPFVHYSTDEGRVVEAFRKCLDEV